MNTLIETLNQWGEAFLDFALPMAWQAGLLIAVLFAFDFAFRGKIRASVRYSLWLVVLLKLVLPPALALPTSPAWWLHRNPPTISFQPAIKTYQVSEGEGISPDNFLKSAQAFEPPRPAMTASAWLLVCFGVVSVGLLVWLLVRWWQIARLVARAEVSERLTAIAAKSSSLTGVTGRVPVKLTANTMSPALCGLFRPAILIPQVLADQFSDEQLRAVLLHELIHLRRRDVWLNFLQTLLQIVYWWHPLVWLANTRIRRLREEAVDDAVMLTLAGEAEDYASTLLEVAKLALNRPLASLGLVGILESRSALRQRIERLVDFRPPRRAGLTLVSILGVLAFTAVAVPMGGAPGLDESTPPPAAFVPVATNNPEVRPPQVYIEASFYRLRDADFEPLVSSLNFNQAGKNYSSWWSVSPDKWIQLNESLKASGLQPYSRPRIQTTSGQPADFSVGNGDTNGLELDCLPFVVNGSIILTSQSRILQKVHGVAVTNQFSDAAIENRGGIVLHLKAADNLSGSNVMVVLSARIIPDHYAQRLEGNVTMTQPSADDAAKVATLIQDGKVYYEMGKLDDAEASLQSALALDADNAAAKYYLGLTDAARQQKQSSSLTPSIFSHPKIGDKLERIRLDQFNLPGNVTLAEATRSLSRAANLADPEESGVNIIISSATDVQGAGADSIPINSLSLKGVTLHEALDAITLFASRPIKYAIMDDDIVFSMRKPADTQSSLFVRTFKLDKAAFSSGLQRITGLPVKNDSDIADAAIIYFNKLGVDWGSPRDKLVFYNDRLGLLFVKATESDLDIIDPAIVRLDANFHAQVHLKARFLEVPRGISIGQTLNHDVGGHPNQFVGILNHENFKTVLQTLEQQDGVEELAEPEVVTLSGRHTKVKATKTITIVTGFSSTENYTNGSISVSPVTSEVEFGPVFDVSPFVLSDGYSVQLDATASRLEFLGYADVPTNAAVQHLTNSLGQTYILPNIWPAIQNYEESANSVLYDGQTLVLAPQPEVVQFGAADIKREAVVARHVHEGEKIQGEEGKELLVFVTVNIIDAAGNRIHSDDDMSFANNKIPPQPSLSPPSVK